MVYVVSFLEKTESVVFFKVYKTILIVNILSKKEEGGKRRNQGNKELTEQQRTKISPDAPEKADGGGMTKEEEAICCVFVWLRSTYLNFSFHLFGCIYTRVYCICMYTCSIWPTGHVSISISESMWDVCLKKNQRAMFKLPESGHYNDIMKFSPVSNGMWFSCMCVFQVSSRNFCSCVLCVLALELWEWIYQQQQRNSPSCPRGPEH